MVATYPSFATPDQYAEWTGAPAPDGIEDLLDAASSMIRRYCGWHVAPVVTEELVVDGRGGATVMLPTLRLLNLLALSEVTSSTVITVYPPTEVEWSRDGYLRKRGCGHWTDYLQGITAEVEHGFADYGDLTVMVLTMVARAKASPFGLTNQAVGSVSVGVSTTPGGQAGGLVLFDHQMLELDVYRIFGRP
jgi:hypothetical protein